MDDDIKSFFFEMNPHKALGSDGFGANFFQAYWPIMDPQICLAIHGFFHHGCPPASLNHTIITLIPKTSSPETPNHFRPVSLINTIYKAISKLLVQILCLILKSNISPLQNAFTPNKSIHEFMIVSLLFRRFSTHSKSLLVILDGVL